jgi:hypothetical protein
MAGGVWRGEVKGSHGKTTRIETRVERDLKGKAFTFGSSFDGVTQYRGFYAYDAAKKTIVFSYIRAQMADRPTGPLSRRMARCYGTFR